MAPVHAMALVAGVALAACSQNPASTDSASTGGTGFPYLGLTSKVVDFGVVQSGSSADATVTIANVGIADLEIHDVGIADDEPSLTTDWSGPISVSPGEFVSVSVDWTPTTYADLASSLTISTNDVVRPLAEVGLIGATPDPDIDVTPVAWDFGTVDVGTTHVMGVSIFNVGAADLTITSLDFTASDGDLTMDYVTLPAVVAPSESLDLRVRYEPTNTGVDSGTLVVGSNDPDEPVVTVGQSGACAAIYDAFDDFDYFVNDDSHDWQYGYASSVGGELTFDTVTFDAGPFSGWAREADICPNVGHNTTGKDAEDSGTFWPGSEFITMHPGSLAVERYSVLRFVVPADGVWRIEAGFKTVSLPPHPGATDTHVVVAGVEKFEADVAGSYEGDLKIDDPYDEELTLLAGDTIDFVVGPGPNESYSYDTTAVRARVTLE